MPRNPNIPEDHEEVVVRFNDKLKVDLHCPSAEKDALLKAAKQCREKIQAYSEHSTEPELAPYLLALEMTQIVHSMQENADLGEQEENRQMSELLNLIKDSKVKAVLPSE